MTWLNPETLRGFDACHLSCVESRVRLARLDDLDLPRTSIIKLDVEGAEASVLRGGMKTIEGQSPSFCLKGRRMKSSRCCAR